MKNHYNICVIIVTYNSESTIRACLDSVIGQLSSEDKILVFDNASSDSTVSILRGYGPKISPIFSSINYGFSAACNLCARKATLFEYIAFINPDVVIGPDLVSRAKFIFFERRAQLIGFSCKDGAGKPDRNYRRYPTVSANLLTAFDGILSRTKLRGIGTFNLDKHYLDGSCMFISRREFIKAGLFPDLFLYGEDVVLCAALKGNGVRFEYQSDITYQHARGSSSSDIAGERSWKMLENMVYGELFYLRDLRFLKRLWCLTVKTFEAFFIWTLFVIFKPKNTLSRDYFWNRLIYLLIHAKRFAFDGADFRISRFHAVAAGVEFE